MNNEPVAWMREDGVIALHKQKEVDSQGFKWFSLYTHPAKTLTDEEIKDCMGCLPKYNSEIVDEDLVKFARAILRKAQEK
jgi:hypothetical protein